jgi:polar amino acid transport system substrate-binding protein
VPIFFNDQLAGSEAARSFRRARGVAASAEQPSSSRAVRLRHIVTALLVTVTVAGCGSSKPTGTASSGNGGKIATACESLRAGYPALSHTTDHFVVFLEPGNAVVAPDAQHGYIGAVPDIAQALSECLGFRYSLESLPFAGVIPAISAGHVQGAISGIFDTEARETQVAFVDFLRAREAIVVPRGNPDHITSPSGLCGHSVSEPTGYVEVTYMQQYSRACLHAGKKAITIQQYPDDPSAYQALVSGRVDAHMDGGAGPTAFVAGHPNFQVAIGNITGPRDGMALGKDETELKSAMVGALDTLERLGTIQAIITKWHLDPTLRITAVHVSP